MILLFAFYGGTASAQEPAVTEDSLRIIEPDFPISNAPSRTDPAGMGAEFVSDTAANGELRVQEKDNDQELDHPPNKALYYSLALPGLGQIYNKKTWKVPFVYAAFGAAGYWIHYNTGNYRKYSELYAEEQSDLNLRYMKYWRRNLEISYIAVVGVYALQALDAYVDANLFYWDMDPDLTVRVEPAIEPLLLPGVMPFAQFGLSCKLTF